MQSHRSHEQDDAVNHNAGNDFLHAVIYTVAKLLGTSGQQLLLVRIDSRGTLDH
jgi:hypothetical protein